MQRRPLREDGRQLGRVHRRDLDGIELASEALPEVPRRAEGPLEGHLLVEDHPDQKGERVLGEQLVSLWVP